MAAGLRQLPAVSVPTPPRKQPVAMPLAVPELDPPAHFELSHGLRGTGNGLSGSGHPVMNSIVVFLPVKTAPAARRRATTGASTPSVHGASKATLCAVVGASFVAKTSLRPTGMPWSGPRSRPCAKSASARSASASASSSRRWV
jgi:hypothetical protein